MIGNNSQIKFIKYHALGNDYLFLDSSKFSLPSSEDIKKLCHRNFGIGSDGILYGTKLNGAFTLQIINPDASKAEISGNGLRIFSRSMFDLGYIEKNEKFVVNTFKKSAECNVISPTKIEINMGTPSFDDINIPHFKNFSSTHTANGKTYTYYPVSMGNPHCVIFVDNLSSEEAKSSGAMLESNKMFPEKTNVQFVKILDRNNVAVEIWERGAGYTLASGSSACAVFAVAKRLNLCSSNVIIHMPGGDLDVKATKDNRIVQTGPVEKIAECSVDESYFNC